MFAERTVTVTMDCIWFEIWEVKTMCTTNSQCYTVYEIIHQHGTFLALWLVAVYIFDVIWKKTAYGGANSAFTRSAISIISHS